MPPAEKYSLFLKNSFGIDDVGDTVQLELRQLLDELYEIDDLSANDWEEVYRNLLSKLGELHDPWQVLAVIYRSIELRSDYITAHKVVAKFLRNFKLLFEKLPGRPPYYVPSEQGMRLFESLINPFERSKLRSKAKMKIAELEQLSLLSFLKGVRA